MKKAIVILLSGIISILSVQAQDASQNKPADFAIVVLTAAAGTHYDCTVLYSDGSEFSLEKTLNLPTKDGATIHRNEMDGVKMKVFDYFYKNGYELMSITDVKAQPIRFYFKHKGK
jgi:hypothetical protein